MSSKLSVGVHLLTVLALYPREAWTSAQLARSVNTNPVVARRILGSLREAGFVGSKPGVGGGWVLTADPERLTLLDVLKAVEGECEMFALHRAGPNLACPVGCNIQGVLTEVYTDAWEQMARRLAKSTLAGVVATLKGRMDS